MAVNPPIVDVVPAGSTQSILRELLPNTTYTAYVYHLGPAPDWSFSVPLVVTFTTGAAQATAVTPTTPAAFAGRVDNKGMLHVDGSFGIEVTPMEFPSTIVMEIATETAIGSGVPGGFSVGGVDIARVTANQVVNRTRITATAQNDGKRRWVRAYALRRGAIQSGTTTAIMVSPWGSTAGATSPTIFGLFNGGQPS